jgi:outer membrane protein insertion porin family
MPIVLWARPSYRDHPVANQPALTRRRTARASVCAAALVFFAGQSIAGSAQPAPGRTPASPPAGPPSTQLDVYEGRPIREIILQKPVQTPGTAETGFVPLVGSLAQLARNSIRATPGQPFDSATVTSDIARLNRLGRFRQIEAYTQLYSDGSVAVIYTLAEQPVIQDVQVIGNRELADQDLLEAGGAILVGTPIDRFQIDRAARAIEDRYRARGFYQARVEVDEQVLEESAIIVYRVIEGERSRVTVVEFEGNQAFTGRELKTQIRTTTYIPILERAPLDDEVLREDAANLVRFYRDRGYLDVRIGTRIQPSPDGREVIVSFILDEGPLYSLRSIQVLYTNPDAIRQYREQVVGDRGGVQAELSYLTPQQMRRIGRRPLSDEQVTGLMAFKPGDVYGDDKLRRSVTALENAYAKLGAVLETDRGPISARITTREVRDEQRPEIDLLVFIQEGIPTNTGELIVTGNDLTQNKVILRQLQLRPERPLDLTELNESRRRLEALQLFAPGSVRLNLQPPTQPRAPAAPLPPGPSAPGTPVADDPFADLRDAGPPLLQRDVLVEVDETSTGSFNFGVAYGSDSGVIGNISLTQRNFDIADVPDTPAELFTGRAFRGAGQTFKIELLPGDRIQTYSISLTEPYFLETDYALSGTGFYRRRVFNEYEEERYGGRMGVERRFGTVWAGGLTFRNDWVALSDIDDNAAVDYFDVEDRRRIDGLGLRLIRNTTDDRFRPSRGSRMDFAVEQIGALGGDYDFTKLNAEYLGFFTLYESFLGYRTLLKIDARASYIPQGQDDVPVYERYFLGGQSFRGFRFRAVSPIGIRSDGTLTDDPVGGTWSWFLGAEVQQPIYRDIVALAGFIDTGTVETDFGFDDYRVSVGFGFRILVPQLSRIPLAFDFGFPIVKEDTDRTRLFTFSIDLPWQ